MNTVGEALAAKRALCRPALRCVDTDYHPVSMVTICPWQAKEWTLPWSRLDALNFSNEEQLERVELFFPHHLVIIAGENLRRITDELRTFKVLCLLNLPVSHRAGFKPDAVFITQLEVRLLTDPKSRPSDGLPF